MLKKVLLIIVAAAFMCVPALAGERPEFDAVGDDSANYFNDLVKELVVAANPWNDDSDFTGLPINHPDCDNALYPPCQDPYEFFDGPQVDSDDVCFPNYQSHLTPAGVTPARYIWKILLQMTPDTDLNLNIRDCIVKPNSQTPFGQGPDEGAHQTGRFKLFGFIPVFAEILNPTVSAVAVKGPNGVGAWPDLFPQFVLNYRPMGGLFPPIPWPAPNPIWNLLYTTKAVWEEGLIVKLPIFGEGAAVVGPFFSPVEYPLVAGDIILVYIDTPAAGLANPVDIRYGQDNVVIKYVGITGTHLTATQLTP